MSNTYTTRTEAIQREIVEPLGNHAGEHDIDAIADALIVMGSTDKGEVTYAIDEDADFWKIVENNAL